MRAPHHAVFDLDGTLVDSVVLCTRIINDMFRDRGSERRLSLAEVRTHISLGGVEMLRGLCASEGWDCERDIVEFRARCRELPTPPSSLFPGVRPALERLAAAGVVLSICSNKPQDLCEKIVVDLDLDHLFAAVAGSEATLPLKPDPALYDRALGRAGGRRERSIYVGDTLADLELAKNVRVPFIFAMYGYADSLEPFLGLPQAASFPAATAMIEEALSDAYAEDEASPWRPAAIAAAG